MARVIQDPTRAELLAYLEGVYAEETGGEPVHSEAEAELDSHDGCPCRFDIEEAAYWLAVHFHGGLASNLYAALSTSPYRPGSGVPDLPDDLNDPRTQDRTNSTMLYYAGVDWLRGVA